MPHDHDTRLLNRVAHGDSAALEELYLGYHRRLVRFLSRIASRYDAAEEIINDTFMVVWERAGDFRGASRVSTWIIGIAYRVALKSLRRNDALLRAQAADELREPFVEPTQQTELIDWVARALRDLPPEQRLTMELAYGLGHSIEEIAAITTSPVGTVKARMYHAREKLRRSLPMLGGISESDLIQDVRSL